MADGYQPQLNPASGNETNFGGAPGDWGAGISQGLESAGNSIDNAIHQVKEKQRDAEATQAGVQFAQDSTSLDNAALDARQQAGPGGAGHSDTVNQMVDQASAASLGNIRDRRLREQFTQRYAELKQQLGTREYGWQSGQYVDKLATDFDQQGTTFANHAAATGDPTVMVNAMPSIETTGRALALNPDLQTKLIKEQQNKVALGWAGAAVRLNPYQLVGNAATGQKGLLDNPSFTQYIQRPEMIDELRHQAEVQINHDNAVQEHNAAQAKAAQISKNGVFDYRVSSLGYVPSADEWQDYIQSNNKLGLVEDALKFSDLKDKADINQAYNGMPPAKWHADIQALEQKVANKTATDYDRMHLKNLVAASGPAVDKFNADPQGYAASTTNPAPAIDWTSADPAKLQLMGAARTSWANSFAPSNGVVNPASVMLSADEKKLFTDGLKGGDASQVETLQRLQLAFGPSTTANIASYLMPGDKNLKFMASLNPRGMELYKGGQNALDSKLVRLGAESGEDAATDRAAIADSVKYWQQAIPPDLQPAFMRVAPVIAAGVAHESGNRAPTGDELKSVMANAVQRIAGLQGDGAHGDYTGGFTMWKSGPVWLPQNMSRQEFATRMTRAGSDDWIKAAGGAPYYVGPNGKPAPLSPSQLGQIGTYRLVPTGAGTGVYALADGSGGRLKQKDGRSDWTFNIRNLR